METLSLKQYIEQLNPTQQKMFYEIKTLIENGEPRVKLILFVKQPYFYCPEFEHIKAHFRPSVMLSFFGHHVNIFATAMMHHEADLKKYKLTKKHTLQIELDQALPKDVLSKILLESLHPEGI